VFDVTRVHGKEVYVFRADLNVAPAVLAGMVQVLSPDEHTRAGGFRFETHRRRFIAARALLRLILGSYLKQRPAELRFTYGWHGKPCLSPANDGGQIGFNISHSEESAVFAIAFGSEVGIDIECVRPLEDVEWLAQSVFSPAELDAYRHLTGPKKLEAFYRCWTRKEAFVKAVGDGLAYPLDQLELSLDERATLLRLPGDEPKAAEWSLYDLTIHEPFIGALAVERSDCRVREINILPETLCALAPQMITGVPLEDLALPRRDSPEDNNR
jgi:4'-phosphopantetheinyl transferase